MSILENLLAFFAADGWFMTQFDALYGTLVGILPQLPGIIMVVLGLVVLFLGKKILPLLKILLFFCAGFIASFQLLTPFVCNLLQIEPTDMTAMIIGYICGFIALLLFKYLYYLLVLGVFAGGGFVGAYFLIENVESIKTALTGAPYLQYVIAGAVGLIVLLIGVWMLKFIEMLVTSVGGAYLTAYAFVSIWDYRPYLAWGSIGTETMQFAISTLVIAGVLALIGFFTQVRTRRLY